MSLGGELHMVAIEEDDSSEDADASTDDDIHVPATDGQESTPHLPEIQQYVPATDGQESTPHLPDIQQHVSATDGHFHILTNMRMAPCL